MDTDTKCIAPGCDRRIAPPSNYCPAHLRKRRRLRRQMDRAAWWAAFKRAPQRLWCRLFGHRQPYVERFTASQCGRCGVVVKDRPRLVIPISRLK